MFKKPTFYLSLIIFLAFLMHFNDFSTDIQGLHSWRQSQTMWNVKNFIHTDGNILNPRTNVFNGDNDNIYRYEFPIMQWSIAMVQKYTSENFIVVRLLMFLIGGFGVFGMFKLVTAILQNKFIGVLSAFFFQLSPIFYYYCITPLPDILALTASIWYLYFIFQYHKKSEIKHLVYASIFLLIATWAKLPFLMFSIVSIYFIFKKIIQLNKINFKLLKEILIPLIFILPALIWYAWVMPTWEGNPILEGVFSSSFSAKEYIRLLGFQAVKMFPNKLLYFPVWVPFFLGLYILIKNRFQWKWLFSLIAITFLYLFLQLTPIGRDHDYYLLPFLPWLFICISFGIHFMYENFKYSKIFITIMLVTSIIYTITFTKSWHSLEKTNFNNDVFIFAHELKNVVPDNELCIILNDHSDFIFAYQINKMGYVFKDDNLPTAWIDDMVRNQNVRYMYSDSENINTNPEVNAYIEKLLLSKGSINVYQLKIP